MSERLSHSEHVKKLAMQKQKAKDDALKEMLSQMVLDEAWFLNKRKELLKKVDQALDERNAEAFLKWSSQYQKLMKNW